MPYNLFVNEPCLVQKYFFNISMAWKFIRGVSHYAAIRFFDIAVCV